MKTKSLRILLVFFLILCPYSLCAYDFEVDGIYYNQSGSKATVTYETTSYNSYSGEVVIPETITYDGNTYTVTKIGSQAFYNCKDLTSVTIPESITAIGHLAFYGCTGLTEVNFNATACSTVIDGGTDIDFYAFRGCTNISTVNIGDNVTIIPSYTFKNCTTLKEITIPANVTSIGSEAFYGCSWLMEINFNAANCSVKSDTFSRCTSVSKITIGSEVTTIPSNISFDTVEELYFNATACTSANSSWTNITKAVIGENVTIIPANLFYNCAGLIEVTIPNRVTEIGNSAFYNCTGITEVNYNATACESAGSASSPVFDGCTNLTKITMGDNVTTIPSYLFYNCAGLTEVTIPNRVTEIGNSAFYNCTGITEVNYNATACESAGSSSSLVFSGCTSVVNLIIGENVAAIPEYTFQGCTNLTDITLLGTTPPTIYGTTFANVSDVAVPKEALNKYALADIWTDIPRIYSNSDGNTYYPIPISYDGAAAIIAVGGDENGTVATAGSIVEITSIEGNNLEYGLATHLTEDITDVLVNNGKYSFTSSEYHKENIIYCYSPDTENLYNITVSEAGQVLEKITTSNINSVYSLKLFGNLNGTDIFTIRRMTNLRMLDISEANIVSGGSEYYDDYTTTNNQIGSNFFYDMTSLKLVKLPNSVTSIGSYAFANCTKLAVLSIPKNITTISNDAFSNCSSLINFTFEDGENNLSISSSAFQNCPIGSLYVGRNLSYSSSILPFKELSTLKSLIFGEKVSSIAQSEFEGCNNLISLYIGNGIKSIGERAFYGCSSMEEASLGRSIDTINENAFANCVSLLELTSKNPTPPSIESNTFDNVDKETCSLNVPTGSLNAYWLDKYWSEFFNIYEMEFPDDIYGELIQEIESTNELLEDAWETIMTDYADVSNEYKNEYDSIVTELNNILDELNDAYENDALTETKAASIRQNLDNVKDEIAAMLASAKAAHETAKIELITNGEDDGAQIYDIMGNRYNSFKKGINIIKYSNGTTKKVLIR